MSQDTTVPGFPEDRQFLEDHGLGLLLGGYRVKEREIRYFRNMAWSIIILSLLSLSVLIILDIRNWQQILELTTGHRQDLLEVAQRYNQPFLFFRSLFSMGGLFLLGLFLLRVRVPLLKRGRVLVCEQGFLQVRGVVREKREMVRWEEIQSLSQSGRFPDREKIHLVYRGNKTLVIRDDYEKFDELLTRIRQYSHVLENRQ